MRQQAGNLASLLAELYGPDLERLKLWTRIDSALRTACAKVRDGNLELFVNHCLEHVKAEPGRACNSEPLRELLWTLSRKPLPWRQAFVRYIEKHIYAVLVHGKHFWEVRKVEIKAEAAS